MPKKMFLKYGQKWSLDLCKFYRVFSISDENHPKHKWSNNVVILKDKRQHPSPLSLGAAWISRCGIFPSPPHMPSAETAGQQGFLLHGEAGIINRRLQISY